MRLFFKLLASLTAFITIFSFNVSAYSEERLEGFFIAMQECEAFQSKNRKTNPGDVVTVEMRAYEMLSINKSGGDYFRIKVTGAPVLEERWVHVSCGIHVIGADTPTADPVVPAEPVVTSEANESADNLLALSWQPAFCEFRPNKTECKALNDGHLPVTETQLSLHGLWPQPRGNDYCGVSPVMEALDKDRRWEELPALPLTAETRELLDVAMPGTASFLHRHEWIKHGTCYFGAGGAEEYFVDSLHLMDQINDSKVGEFLASHVGAQVETADIRALFDEEFGDGAGNKVQFDCRGDQGRVLIRELKINLRGRILEDTELFELLSAADDQSIGCPRGIIDPAGLQ